MGNTKYKIQVAPSFIIDAKTGKLEINKFPSRSEEFDVRNAKLLKSSINMMNSLSLEYNGLS